MPRTFELQKLVGGVRQRNGQDISYLELLKSKCVCPYMGIMLAALSSLFFSLCSVIVKGLVDVDPIELASFR